jgi:hypothetical protein
MDGTCTVGAQGSYTVFQLHVAVSPNGICVALLAILAGGRHDKRALDDTDAYLRFAYVAPSGQAAVYSQRLFAALFDSGYI